MGRSEHDGVPADGSTEAGHGNDWRNVCKRETRIIG